MALPGTALKRLFTGQSVAHSSPQLRTGLQLNTHLRRGHPLCSTLPDKCAAIVQRRRCCGTGSWNLWRTPLKLSLAKLAICCFCLIYVGVNWREIAAATALRYGQVESVAHGLFDVLNKHEHIPAVIADIAEFASHRNHDNRLVRPLRRLLRAAV